MHIRPEQARDHAALRALNTLAFGGPAEAELVDRLRRQTKPLISLVAELGDGGLAGHILFSPVLLPGHDALRLMGLAPMAVAPALQGRGIGSALVRAGLEVCRTEGVDAVVVLGHPAFYPRFGFRPAGAYGLRCPYPAPPEAFMVRELAPGALRGAGGTIAFHPGFDEL